MYTHVSLLKNVYAFSLHTHYFSCTRFLRFLPHPRCIEPLYARCRWKVCGEVANHLETKGFFLLCSHVGAISKTAVPLPGVPNPLTWCLSFLSHPSCLILVYENIKREKKRATKVVLRIRDMLSRPLLLFTSSVASSSSDNWDSGAVEPSNHHRGCPPVTSSTTDQAGWLFSNHIFNP